MKSPVDKICAHLAAIISETNGLGLMDTLQLLIQSYDVDKQTKASASEFMDLLNKFRTNKIEIDPLLNHDVAKALFQFLRSFPLKFREEHIHLTGSLTADFVYPRLKKLIEGPQKKLYVQKIDAIYGEGATAKIKSAKDVDNLMRLRDNELFSRYLEILILPKLVLLDKKSHKEAAHHLAQDLYNNYNVGAIRLKFTLSRATQNSKEQIPGADSVSSEDVVMGLYEGFKSFQKTNPDFEFILSPCFRKEPDFFDASKFKTKKDHFNHQVKELLDLLEKYPELTSHVTEVDTVGSEAALHRKQHFEVMKVGFRKLQARGIKIRSHHGETWKTLKTGIQAVDNAMNIWHIDAIEHGLSLGINPNFYFHSLFQNVLALNQSKKPLDKKSSEYQEIISMDWSSHEKIRDKIIEGKPLNDIEKINFIKTKFHTAREIEYYQHDILNRAIDKGLSMIALPSSNKKLTGQFEDYKEHPFSWWEKKGVKLGVGTDNYVTLNTNFIREMLIILLTDPIHLKITKLLLVCTGEKRRPYLSQMLWKYRKQFKLGTL